MLGQRLSANGFDCVVAPLIEVRTLVVPSVLVNHQHEENLTRALAVLPDNCYCAVRSRGTRLFRTRKVQYAV